MYSILGIYPFLTVKNFIIGQSKNDYVPTLKNCFYAGFGAALNGATLINSHFRFFRANEMSDEWSKGNDAGKQAALNEVNSNLD